MYMIYICIDKSDVTCLNARHNTQSLFRLNSITPSAGSGPLWWCVQELETVFAPPPYTMEKGEVAEGCNGGGGVGGGGG